MGSDYRYRFKQGGTNEFSKIFQRAGGQKHLAHDRSSLSGELQNPFAPDQGRVMDAMAAGNADEQHLAAGDRAVSKLFAIRFAEGGGDPAVPGVGE